MYQKAKSKYSTEQTQAWSVAAMVVLSDSKRAMTCDEIRQSDLSLIEVTPQKMSRILTELCEGGFVMKTKGKNGRMVYKSVGVVLDEGYNPSEMVY